MDKVLDSLDDLIITLNEMDFVKDMKVAKKEIIDNHLINTKDVKKLYENTIIHKYVESMNTLDYHIYYLNKEMDKLISNKKCGV